MAAARLKTLGRFGGPRQTRRPPDSRQLRPSRRAVAGPGFCAACVCALVDVYMPAFVAGGLTVGADSTEFPIAQASAIIEARCAAAPARRALLSRSAASNHARAFAAV